MANKEHVDLVLNRPKQIGRWQEKHLAEPLDLQNADLRMAKLKGVNLRYARLNGADLTNVDLGNAVLNGVDLTGAKIDGVNWYGTSLWHVTGLPTKVIQELVKSWRS